MQRQVTDDLMVRCACGIEYLSVADLSEDGIVEYSLSITSWPHTLRGRLAAAWQALRGHKFYYSEVILLAEDVRRLREWIEARQ
jgi:hypothetical protein